MNPDLSLVSKEALRRLAKDIDTALKKVLAEYRAMELRLSEAEGTLATWEDRTVKRQILSSAQMQISKLRTELSDVQKALKERRPAILRVFLNDLALEEPRE